MQTCGLGLRGLQYLPTKMPLKSSTVYSAVRVVQKLMFAALGAQEGFKPKSRTQIVQEQNHVSPMFWSQFLEQLFLSGVFGLTVAVMLPGLQVMDLRRLRVASAV